MKKRNSNDWKKIERYVDDVKLSVMKLGNFFSL